MIRLPPSPSVSPQGINQTRKMKKPLMEKKRRKRINDSLSWLKDNLFSLAPHHRSKLEKADILELTIEYIKMLQSSQSPSTHSNSSYRRGLQDGFSHASRSTFDFLNLSFPSHSPSGQHVQSTLLTHLSESCRVLLSSLPSSSSPSTLSSSSDKQPELNKIDDEELDIVSLDQNEEMPKKPSIWRPQL
ncbi:hypothetical protein PENTCL1PPCAC_6695 [Pristionchus entomophagus]|uniref:BHLH domain-containing protein n=1 Tax=Pristionchus entomophagus TaxID=358040 RepID=A0AAV5SPJ9_9BILA|nr:hypothetical protein PENTCL1PPCAC_6695 [Pristionchus entomophagus]